MDSGYNLAENRGELLGFCCGRAVASVWLACGWMGVLVRRPLLRLWQVVHKLYSAVGLVLAISTVYPQVLRIQFPFDAANGGAHISILDRLFFNLFNRVDGGGMVFAPKFTGNFRETEV